MREITGDVYVDGAQVVNDGVGVMRLYEFQPGITLPELMAAVQNDSRDQILFVGKDGTVYALEADELDQDGRLWNTIAPGKEIDVGEDVSGTIVYFDDEWSDEVQYLVGVSESIVGPLLGAVALGEAPLALGVTALFAGAFVASDGMRRRDVGRARTSLLDPNETLVALEQHARARG
jgi:hypothetical protein